MILDPIIGGIQFSNVLMDGGSGLNMIYQDTIQHMGINPARICRSKTSFQGVIPGPDTHCMGFLRLEVIFGSADNLRREKLTFHIVPFSSRYQALLGREAFARFNAICISYAQDARSTRHHLFEGEALKCASPSGGLCGRFNSPQQNGLTGQKKLRNRSFKTTNADRRVRTKSSLMQA